MAGAHAISHGPAGADELSAAIDLRCPTPADCRRWASSSHAEACRSRAADEVALALRRRYRRAAVGHRQRRRRIVLHRVDRPACLPVGRRVRLASARRRHILSRSCLRGGTNGSSSVKRRGPMWWAALYAASPSGASISSPLSSWSASSPSAICLTGSSPSSGITPRTFAMTRRPFG